MDRIQFRRDTLDRWNSVNPILLEGEIGYVLDDPNRYKMGDGVKTWDQLPFRGFDGTIVHNTGDSENAVMSQKATSEAILKQAVDSGFAVKTRFGVDDDGNWTYNGFTILKVESLSELKIKQNGNNFIYYTVLKDFTGFGGNNTLSYATGYSGRVTQQGGSTYYSLTIPYDGKYLYIQTNLVEEVLCQGVDLLSKTFSWRIFELERDVRNLNSTTVKDSDLTIILGKNIANKENIEDKSVGNDGNITASTTWQLISIDVSGYPTGQKFTFGGFYLGRSGYYAFYNSSSLIESNNFSDPNGDVNPITIEKPENATTLYIDIKTNSSPLEPYEYLMVNLGTELLHYEDYTEHISEIGGKKLAGSDSITQEDIEGLKEAVLELQNGAADVIANLPVSVDGSDISVGYAYIESSTGNVKVKMN